MDESDGKCAYVKHDDRAWNDDEADWSDYAPYYMCSECGHTEGLPPKECPECGREVMGKGE